jgi:predicted amidohydrolase YtcJ
MGTAPKRIGRPFKPPEAGERAVLGLRVRAELKRQIDEAAAQSGRTQSQEAEFLIEQGLIAAELLAMSSSKSTEEQAQAAAENNFRRRGYTWIHYPRGKVWLPPGMPGGSHSEWLDPESEQEK